MHHTLRRPLFAAFAACVSLVVSASACDRDEPATYTPTSGEWIFENFTMVSNSCSADLTATFTPLTSLTLDYDDGDSFQVELGQDDVTCEIDGTDFYCTDFALESEVPGVDATIRFERTWEGEFLSDSEADVTEIYSVTCSGESCELVETAPCAYKATYEASAV